MGYFDTPQDAPHRIWTEGVTVTLTFSQTSPDTGIVNWNLPVPAQGCNADTMAYCGMVVIINAVANGIDSQPTDGIFYIPDATADRDLFAGDTMKRNLDKAETTTALVVGAFYNDIETTSLEITGLKPNTAYFVTGYPVDCQGAYYTRGVHAYSLIFKSEGTDDCAGSQCIVFQNDKECIIGIDPAESTGLTPGIEYSINLVIDGQKYTLTVDGTYAETYAELAAALQIALDKVNNPYEGPTPPNVGNYYWDAATQKLFLWNGSDYVGIPIFVSDVDPSDVVDGYLWYNTLTNELKKWNATTSLWEDENFVNSPVDPNNYECGTYWYNGSLARIWEGSVWCDLTTYIQSTDPSDSPVISCGTYWYDDVTEILYEWDENAPAPINPRDCDNGTTDPQTGGWVATTAVVWNTRPDMLVDGTYWIDDDDLLLYQWNATTTSWTQLTNVTFSEERPILPQDMDYWVNSLTFELEQWDDTTSPSQWNTLEAIVFPEDPTDVDSCDLWWDTTDDTLYIWQNIVGTWNQVVNFIIGGPNPAFPKEIIKGDAWFNSNNDVLAIWDGMDWIQTEYIFYVGVLESIPTSWYWRNETTKQWFKQITAPNVWDEVIVFAYPFDPTAIPVGFLWFDTANDELNLWNGTVWVPIPYSTSTVWPSPGD